MGKKRSFCVSGACSSLSHRAEEYQPIDVGGRKGNGGIKQAARQAQGRQPALHSLPPARGGFTHRRISGPSAASLWRITKCPATPRVVAL